MQINEQGKEPRRLLWVFSSYYYYNYLLYGQSLSAFVSLLACVFINKAWAEWRPRPHHCRQAGGGHFRGHLFHSLEAVTVQEQMGYIVCQSSSIFIKSWWQFMDNHQRSLMG